MTRTVDLEPLSQRVFSKYLKYIDDKIKQEMKKPLMPKSSLFLANRMTKLGGEAGGAPIGVTDPEVMNTS